MTRSLPDPILAAFDPEIERTLSHIRRARRRLASEGGEVIIINSQSHLRANLNRHLRARQAHLLLIQLIYV